MSTVSLVTCGLYLVLYNGFDKSTKKLSFNKLLSMFSSLDVFLVEFNKTISLVGITILILYPMLLDKQLLIEAILLIVIHSSYSLFKYYGTQLIAKFGQGTWVKRIGVLSGVIANLIQCYQYLHEPEQLLFRLCIGFSLMHFYLMEIDFKWKLQVRPFAYLPFILAPIALIYI